MILGHDKTCGHYVSVITVVLYSCEEGLGSLANCRRFDGFSQKLEDAEDFTHQPSMPKDTVMDERCFWCVAL